ncbi:MAG: virulence protein RhuM/Fic/DOC family protein [Muribaculaceae bacterium]|nr:virulence protein RhuM/Fic/DOC family protein [Muribaculaceae bacterium]
MERPNNQNRIVIYQTVDGETNIDVTFQDETVWLSQAQMAELFQKDRTVISRHINNIFKEGELERETTCANFAHMGVAGDRQYITTLYNLDVIISVGYRVKSKRGTQFRIWANKVIKQYLLHGFVVNERLALQKYDELSQLVKIIGRTIQSRELLTADSRSLLDVVVDYTYALDTLDRYDYQDLKIEDTTGNETFHATYENAMEVIRELHSKFGGSTLFGNEKDDSFKSSIGQIYQTFGGIDLYPSVEEKAAMLLYLVTKNHSFSDGNKRIAATLFLWFLNGNGILYNNDGSKRIADNTLVALTLMIAESRTEEKDTMVKVIVNLINKNN